tara:strand:+ start:1661 stop:1813 length:153 start_codon:yes stop_codon:yes gene_type:complete
VVFNKNFTKLSSNVQSHAVVNGVINALMSWASWADALKDTQQVCAGVGGC